MNNNNNTIKSEYVLQTARYIFKVWSSFLRFFLEIQSGHVNRVILTGYLCLLLPCKKSVKFVNDLCKEIVEYKEDPNQDLKVLIKAFKQ